MSVPLSASLSIPPNDVVYAALEDVRARRPLVQNITNYVAMGMSANVLLALGRIARHGARGRGGRGLRRHLGCPGGQYRYPVAALGGGHAPAVARARAMAKPWVLDPVGCGATSYRTRVAAELAALAPAIIRGNASEILSLAGSRRAGGKGVDFDRRLRGCGLGHGRAGAAHRRGRRRDRRHRLCRRRHPHGRRSRPATP